MRFIRGAIGESAKSVLPIAAIVLILSVSLASVDSGILVLFIFGTVLLIFGMSLFTVGSGMSMDSLGEGIGVQIGRAKRFLPAMIVCFVLGALITIAEPDLQVLAQQVPSIPNAVLIWSVALGVGIFLVVSMVRTRKNIRLSRLLCLFYIVVMALAVFAPNDFIPTAFDSGGVTTGPITVPFIMALGAGMASVRNGRNSGEDSFGLVALCSIGPILSVLILSICFSPKPETTLVVLGEYPTTKDAFLLFLKEMPLYAKEVSVAFLPLVGVFLLFQIFYRRFHRSQALRISVGMIYTFIGLVFFLTGANAGFMPAGRLIGATIASGGHSYWLVAVGMLMGYFVVSAEPAVHTLKKQVEEVTNGAISQQSIGRALSIGVGFSVGVSMLRVLTGISIYPFLLGGYIISLVITFFVPPIYTGIAFDSGGVASGPMTTTFMLPFAVGACEAFGGNVMTDAFGLVSMVAMTPLITIQSMGLWSRIRRKRRIARVHYEMSQVEDVILYYDEC